MEAFQAFSDGTVVKNPLAHAGDEGLIPGLGGSPGEGNGNPLQYSCLENPMDKGAWWATVPGFTELDMTKRLNLHNFAVFKHAGRNESQNPFFHSISV